MAASSQRPIRKIDTVLTINDRAEKNQLLTRNLLLHSRASIDNRRQFLVSELLIQSLSSTEYQFDLFLPVFSPR